jgi:hypothetical protein
MTFYAPMLSSSWRHVGPKEFPERRGTPGRISLLAFGNDAPDGGSVDEVAAPQPTKRQLLIEGTVSRSMIFITTSNPEIGIIVKVGC